MLDVEALELGDVVEWFGVRGTVSGAPLYTETGGGKWYVRVFDGHKHTIHDAAELTLLRTAKEDENDKRPR